MQLRSICNLKKSTPSRAEDAAFRVSRTHLNQIVLPGYNTGDIFDYVFSSDSGVWLKDSFGIVVFVPNGEIQCFEEI